MSAQRVLIVEDDGEIRDSMTELLEGEGYAVSQAPDGKKALDFLRGGTELPALILLDLMMPVMDGFEFRDAQLKDPKLANIPVLLMSAGGDLAAKAAALGAKGYLKKPFGDLDSIFASVRRALA